MTESKRANEQTSSRLDPVRYHRRSAYFQKQTVTNAHVRPRPRPKQPIQLIRCPEAWPSVATCGGRQPTLSFRYGGLVVLHLPRASCGNQHWKQYAPLASFLNSGSAESRTSSG